MNKPKTVHPYSIEKYNYLKLMMTVFLEYNTLMLFRMVCHSLMMLVVSTCHMNYAMLIRNTSTD